jgi:hypothetical protein
MTKIEIRKTGAGRSDRRKWLRTIPPIGRARYWPRTANDTISEMSGVGLGKMASAMSLAKMPKMTKS